MRLTDLVQRSGAPIDIVGDSNPGEVQIHDITFDSRNVQPGTLFVALAGARSDGHDYLGAAIASGAAAALVAADRAGEFTDLGVPLLVVDEPRRRLGAIAAAFFDHPSHALSVIGITGTNGKTTITYLVEAILQHVGLPAGVIGTVNYRWPGHLVGAPNTTPESLVIQRLLARMRDDEVEAVAMEVSSHGLATHRLEGTAFDVGVFTNLSQDHLDFHASMQAYTEAKRALFTQLLPRSAGRAVVNVDDLEGRRLVELLDQDVITTSAEGRPATWSCTQCRERDTGIVLTVDSPHGVLQVETQLLGRFNASNVIQALAATSLIGVDARSAAQAFEQLRGVPGRLQHIGGQGRPRIFVDYAHTPDALERALEALRPLTDGRLWVLFGCGGDRDREKRPIMGAVAAAGADAVVVTSDNPRSEDPAAIVAEIERGMPDASHTVIVDRAEAIRHVVAHASPDDVILIAGKGHETYQEVAGERRSFDDMQHAQLALESWR